MNSIKRIPDSQQQALIESLAKISAVFWGPDEARCQEMLNGNYFAWFQQLKDLLQLDPPDALEKMESFFYSFPDSDNLYAALEETYIQLFISSKGGIAAPLYQSCYEYENAPLMGPPALLMQEKLENKGLSVGGQLNEPPDHLAIEIEYLYFLLQKGWVDNEDSCLEEAVEFSKDVMLKWIVKFRQKLTENPDAQFYFLTVSILIAILKFFAAKK
jgi:TorA-specific chaperone